MPASPPTPPKTAIPAPGREFVRKPHLCAQAPLARLPHPRYPAVVNLSANSTARQFVRKQHGRRV